MFEKWKKTKQTQESDEMIDEMTLDDHTIVELLKEAEQLKEKDIQQHEKHFSADGLWKKIQKVAKKAGSTVVYVVLILFFTLQKPEVPLKVKATIAGALGYFILPFDLLPDVALGAGYIDDLSIITAALIQVSMYVDEDIKRKAKTKLTDWFGDSVDTSEVDKKLQ